MVLPFRPTTTILSSAVVASGEEASDEDKNDDDFIFVKEDGNECDDCRESAATAFCMR